jgi:hypothetical protein
LNPVARVEDEGLHLGVPTLGLMSKMDAGFQQFFNTDGTHDFNFPLVKTPNQSRHPAEYGIVFDVIVAVCPHSKTNTFRP